MLHQRGIAMIGHCGSDGITSPIAVGRGTQCPTFRVDWGSCAMLATLVLPLVGLFGCGDGGAPKRVIVSGAVTFNGKPVPTGMIRFLPDSSSPVPMGGASIVEGRYRADSRGGVPVGTHRIEIEAFQSKPGTTAGPMVDRGGPSVQYLPERYNVKSQMQMTIEPGSGEIIKDFKLTD